MNKVSLDINGKTASFEVTKKGRLIISIPNGIKTTIIHSNAGEPGLIGPDIRHDLDELSLEIVEKAFKKAFNEPIYNKNQSPQKEKPIAETLQTIKKLTKKAYQK